MMRTLLFLIAALPSAAFSGPSLGLRNHHVNAPRLDPAPPPQASQSCMNMVNTGMSPFPEPASNYSATAALPYLDGSSAGLNEYDTISVDTAGLVEFCSNDNSPANSQSNLMENILSSYMGPRIMLGCTAVLYGTNFPLGAIMNDNLPASAATSSRMVLASMALFPFLLQLKPNLRTPVLIGGTFVSMGYVAQSIALVDTSPALVSFLGSLTVLVCPLLQWLVDKKPMGIKEAPQTWLAAALCLSGVAALELFGGSDGTSAFSLAESLSRLGVGDALSVLQAVGFGTGIYMSEKMMKTEPDQAIQITAGLVTTTAFFAMLWCLADGWMSEPGWESMGLPGLFFDPNMRTVALAVAWTGILSTSINFCIEIIGIGRVPSSEASVILATEPLWASLFAAILFHETFGTSDYVGGALMISAILVNTLKPEQINGFLSKSIKSSE